MGVGYSENAIGLSPRDQSEMFDVANDNGYVLCNKYFVPEEVLALILSHVPPKQLVFTCRRVCKYWCNVIDSLVWRIKLRRLRVPPSKVTDLPWHTCYWILKRKPLGRNLVKNSCGQDGLKKWDVLSCGGDGWKVEKPPTGCEDFPKEEDPLNSTEDVLKHNSCWATSFYSCTKRQLIDLKDEGVCPEVMDKLRPRIIVNDWCCGRHDCASIYELKVKLLSDTRETIADFEVRKRLGLADGCAWEKVSHEFTDYGPGVKFIEFYHGGMDSQFWKGHYGSKMTGAFVTLSVT